MKESLKKNSNSIIFLIIIGAIIFFSYFLDKELGKVLGVAGFFVWFLREYLKNWLDKDLEQFKYNLTNESTRFKIQYEKLHLERVEIIKQCYQQTVKVTKQLSYLTSDLEYNDKNQDKDKYIKLYDEFRELTSYYEINALYFEKDIQKLFDALFQWIFQMFTLCHWLQHIRVTVTSRESEIIEEEITEDTFNERKMHLETKMDEELNSLKNKLEDKFKNIIGLEI